MNKLGTLSDNAHEFNERYSTDTEQQLQKTKRKWLVADYEAGDVVFHDAYMIHASGKNEDHESGRIRLSTDIRFYEEGSDLDDRWMKLWEPGDGL